MTNRMTADELAKYAPPSADTIYARDVAALQAENDRAERRAPGSSHAHARPIVVPDDPGAPPVDPYQRDAQRLRDSY